MHCPECGFVNAEGANYCQKCGAFLGEAKEGESGGDTTEVYQVDESGELKPVDLEEVTGEGATLVIRSGGGRAGEAFNASGERMTSVPSWATTSGSSGRMSPVSSSCHAAVVSSDSLWTSLRKAPHFWQ